MPLLNFGLRRSHLIFLEQVCAISLQHLTPPMSSILEMSHMKQVYLFPVHSTNVPLGACFRLTSLLLFICLCGHVQFIFIEIFIANKLGNDHFILQSLLSIQDYLFQCCICMIGMLGNHTWKFLTFWREANFC